MEDKTFQKALVNFMNDFASGDSIRHLADKGMTVKEISEKLLFPTPKERIAEEVWKRYLETGKICLEEPKAGQRVQKVRYVKEQSAYGKISMRRIVEEETLPDGEYILCDFGKQLYKDRTGFEKKLEKLWEKDRDYILGLPWPLAPVYHVADERMKRIQRALDIANSS